MLQLRDADLAESNIFAPETPGPQPECEEGSEPDSEEDTNSEIASLLRQNSESEASSEESSRLPPESGQDHRKYGWTQEHEKPISTLAVLVVAFWTLRIPVIYQDLLRYVDKRPVPVCQHTTRSLLAIERWSSISCRTLTF